jgi:predicted enzyme related to lactoylglutathione lyase
MRGASAALPELSNRNESEAATMHHSRLGGLIIDCNTQDLDRAATFWSRALGCAIRPSGDPDDRNYVILDTPGGEPYIELQRVDHPSRVHLDIKTDDVEAEVRRLEGLGAKRVRQVRHWWVMEAPSGHRFCVVALRPGQDIGKLKSWDD